MGLWAIVPVKPLNRGKSRLSGVLTKDERAALNHSLLENTLNALHTPSVQQTLVISRDPAALALARELGARTVLEDSHSELNLALQRATVVATLSGAERILILPADLPLLDTTVVDFLVQFSLKAPEVLIAPDRHGMGTNALLVNPAGLLQYSFGPGSFQKHCEQARHANARLQVVEHPSLELDLDTPQDLDLLRVRQGTPSSSI